MSPPADVKYSDTIADNWTRLPIEEKHINAFNQGGFEVGDEWKKIRL